MSTQPQPVRRRKKDDTSISEEHGPILEEKKSLKKFKSKSYLHPSNASKIILIIITILSFITRFYKIWEPSEVVFDEVHFGKFASYYLKRTYFFDLHPPLGKLLIALSGYLVGYDGHYLFSNIGENYVEHQVPYIFLRSSCAFFGSLLAPLVYLIMIESGYSVYAATLSSVFVLFDNALISQSRHIFLDAYLLAFLLLAVYSYIRFHKLKQKPFSVAWFFWLISTGTFLSFTLGVKMVGLFGFMLVGISVLNDLWYILDVKNGYNYRQVVNHFKARLAFLLLLPMILYLSFFYIHFQVLNHSGPGDKFMSAKFQATLQGNPLHAGSHDIHYNDQITLLSSKFSAFLHSHPQNYPQKYKDGRVSSQGQQVTGYPHRDENNFWKIKLVEKSKNVNDTLIDDDLVRHGDIVQFEHVSTQTNLMTHDVASPLTRTNMEITTVALDNMAKVNATHWKINIKDGVEGKTIWKTGSSYTSIIHNTHNVALNFNLNKLPEWGFNQFELNGDKNLTKDPTYWIVEEIKGRNLTAEEGAKEHTQLPFLQKFSELQSQMLGRNSSLRKSHPWDSVPAEWPFLNRGISFWTKDKERRQMYLLGNPFSWWLSTVSVGLVSLILFSEIIAERRGLVISTPEIRKHLYRSGSFFLLAWAIHYLPFFTMSRQLFLHHYLPALIFAYMNVGVLFQYIFVVDYRFFALDNWHSRTRSIHPSLPAFLMFSLLVLVDFGIFYFFTATTYGIDSLSKEELLKRQWLSTWDFTFAR